MKVSIVTISFNQADFIEACIESVLDQDYNDIEYIIVDAGSTDGSREIIDQYSSRIAKVIFESDEGPADGLNKGFRCATGDIFGYINADDILLPGAISKIVESFIRLRNADVLCGNGIQLDESGAAVMKLFSTKWSLRRYAYGVSNAVQQSTFFRREVFKQAGGFNIDNHTCWDGELLVDMALSGAKYSLLQSFIGGFRIYVDSISGSGRLQNIYYKDQNRINKKILGRALNNKDKLLSLLFRVEKYAMHPQIALYKLGRLL